MTISVNIDDLINHKVVESTKIEYKENFNPNPIIRSIFVFVNNIDNIGGGYIIVGIQKITGLPLDITFSL